MFKQIDQKAINTIRALSVDAIHKANSGHPGLPLGAAPMAYVLWTKFLKINPLTSTNWTNRDRFILSAGHGSALLYSLLHLSGYEVSLEDMKNFRQWDSKTPGHPEVSHTDGVEATTGPLGQGIAMAVGMAMSEAHLSAEYNKEKFKIVDHNTYVLCGDGDLMEGVSQEACSLAGHLKLGKLIVLYDSNDISLDGPTSKSFTENVGERFKAYGWEHILVEDGNELNEIYEAIKSAKENTTQPTLIEVKTVIGFGSAHQGTSKVHGAPLSAKDIHSIKGSYGFNINSNFKVDKDVRSHFISEIVLPGSKLEKAWNEQFKQYQNAYPKMATQYTQAFRGTLPTDWEKKLQFEISEKSIASRSSSQRIIQSIANQIPYFWSGSADLSASNSTTIADATEFQANNYQGKNIWFGVREFAMAAIMNGIQLHGGTRIFGGTFFVFVDYLRAGVRLSALQKLPVTYVLTHDSIAVGEDGPTHEPVEQLASLRCMPNLNVMRPADHNETIEAWKIAIESNQTPTVLVLTRQNLPTLSDLVQNVKKGVKKGGYIISPSKSDLPAGILIATGSEVHLAIKAQEALFKREIDVSVVSIPSFKLFDSQSEKYKEEILPQEITKRISIEMGSSFGWEKYVGNQGKIMSIDKFGASAPGELIVKNYGFTVENIVHLFETL